METDRKRRARIEAAKKQNNLCFWCSQAMYLGRRKVRANDPMHCTAEHVLPKRFGGTIARENIVAACRKCNVQEVGVKMLWTTTYSESQIKKMVLNYEWFLAVKKQASIGLLNYQHRLNSSPDLQPIELHS